MPCHFHYIMVLHQFSSTNYNGTPKTIATYGILKCTYFRICCYTLYRFIFLHHPLSLSLCHFHSFSRLCASYRWHRTVPFQWSKREPHSYADIFHFIILICANIYGFYFEEEKNKTSERNEAKLNTNDMCESDEYRSLKRNILHAASLECEH